MEAECLDLSQRSRVSCIPEEELDRQMTDTVEPYLEKIVVRGRLETEGQKGADGSGGTRAEGLYYELYPQTPAKGTIVICYGFTESCLKYHELIYYFHRQGYQAAVMDHRGHGKSLRETEDATVVHIGHFSDYVKDLHRFVVEAVKPISGEQPLFLYAHSMGGCVGAFYLEQYPEEFQRAVLNAPMLGLNMGSFPAWAARALCDWKALKGEGKERLFTQSGFDPEEPFEKSAASSEARHAYYQKLRREDEDYHTCSASYCWGREAINAGKFVIRRKQAEKVKTPVLLFQAGQESLVKPSAQRMFLSRIAEGRLMLVEKVRHEIYRAPNEVLEPYLEEIFRFYEGK
ncbi:MAG: lysophospholipase [bacterium]|nr:lysophospholipase [bacterium]